MDLLGSDLPADSSEGIKFAWSDGILLQVEMSLTLEWCFFILLKRGVSLRLLVFFTLQALKQGSWVLLDELNLAPQSVLEVLNETVCVFSTLIILMPLVMFSFLWHLILEKLSINKISSLLGSECNSGSSS